MAVVVEQAKAQRHQTTQTPGRQAAQAAGVQVEQAAPVGQVIRLLHLRLKEMLVGPVMLARGFLVVEAVVQELLVPMERPALWQQAVLARHLQLLAHL
jgi:hypothetical protein